MLFTDGPFVNSASLNIIDGEFDKVAADCKIVVDGSSNSLITRSTDGAGTEFLAQAQSFSGYLIGTGVNSNHVAAVLNVLSTAINRPRVMLHQLVVNEPDTTSTALRRWVEYYVLHDFYRSVYHRKIDDRFEKKMDMYDVEKHRHWRTVEGTGFPIVLIPLAAPGATKVYGSGTWGTGNVTAVSGGSAPAQLQYAVSITWCALPAYVSPNNQGQAESAGSTPAAVTVGADQVINVNISSLNPPNGVMPTAVGTAQGIYTPMAATHWNVYAGTTTAGVTSPLILQNSSPIPIGTVSYTFPGAPLATGFTQNAGQPSNYFFTVTNNIWRA